MVKDLMDTFLENTLKVLLKLCEFEGYSSYCGVPRVVSFDVSWEFSTQNACYRFRERLYKDCPYTYISLTWQNYVFFVSLPKRGQVKT
jgi:hypothetical protein